MNDMPAQHANYLADFYELLIERDVDVDVAGTLTIDLNMALLAGTADLPSPTKDEQKAMLAKAAEAKAARRGQASE